MKETKYGKGLQLEQEALALGFRRILYPHSAIARLEGHVSF